MRRIAGRAPWPIARRGTARRVGGCGARVYFCIEGQGESDGLFLYGKEAHSQEFRQAAGILDVPYLLAIQLESYRTFLQENVAETERVEHRPACRLQDRVPDLAATRAMPRLST